MVKGTRRAITHRAVTVGDLISALRHFPINAPLLTSGVDTGGYDAEYHYGFAVVSDGLNVLLTGAEAPTPGIDRQTLNVLMSTYAMMGEGSSYLYPNLEEVVGPLDILTPRRK